VVVAPVDGRVSTGVVVRETGNAIRLVTADCSEVSLPRDKIEAIQPSPVSVMPQGLDANLSRGELADLVAFLHSLHSALRRVPRIDSDPGLLERQRKPWAGALAARLVRREPDVQNRRVRLDPTS